MIEPGQNLAFLFKAATGELGIEAVLDQLDGDALLEGVFANAFVDSAHAALPDQADDAVGADFPPGPCAWIVRTRRRRHARRRW